MATIKNITTVDLIEESTGEENVLSEVNGSLKRLPVSQIKGGSGGAGFDIMGYSSRIFIPSEGELVVIDTPVEVTALDDTSFEEIFGEGPFDTSKFYQRVVKWLEDETIPMKIEVIGFYDNNEWTYSTNPEEKGQWGYKVNAISNTDFEGLKAIKEERPISVLFTMPVADPDSGLPLDTYVFVKQDYTFMKDLILAEISSQVPELENVTDLIVLSIDKRDGSSDMVFLMFFEDPNTGELSVILYNFGY